jgi:hypothetical protein
MTDTAANRLSNHQSWRSTAKNPEWRIGFLLRAFDGAAFEGVRDSVAITGDPLRLTCCGDRVMVYPGKAADPEYDKVKFTMLGV